MRHNPKLILLRTITLLTGTVLTCCGSEDHNPTNQIQIDYDGLWEGTTLQNKQISFTIEDDSVTSVVVSYDIQDGDFVFSRYGYQKVFGTPVAIDSDTFKVAVTYPRSGLDVETSTIWGEFDSDTSAAGRLSAVLFLYDMSGGDWHFGSTEWNATKQ